MTITALIADLESRGFTLNVDGSDIVVSPASKLTDADVMAIRDHKTGVVTRLCGVSRWAASGRSWWCSCGASVAESALNWSVPRCVVCGGARPERIEGAA